MLLLQQKGEVLPPGRDSLRHRKIVRANSVPENYWQMIRGQIVQHLNAVRIRKIEGDRKVKIIIRVNEGGKGSAIICT